MLAQGERRNPHEDFNNPKSLPWLLVSVRRGSGGDKAGIAVFECLLD